MLQLLPCFFAHLLILEYPDHHQHLISSSLYYPGRRPKISSQSVHNFLSNVVHKQTNKQTNQRHQKHNLFCQGGNKGNVIPVKNCKVAFIILSPSAIEDYHPGLMRQFELYAIITQPIALISFAACQASCRLCLFT